MTDKMCAHDLQGDCLHWWHLHLLVANNSLIHLLVASNYILPSVRGRSIGTLVARILVALHASL